MLSKYARLPLEESTNKEVSEPIGPEDTEEVDTPVDLGHLKLRSTTERSKKSQKRVHSPPLVLKECKR